MLEYDELIISINSSLRVDHGSTLTRNVLCVMCRKVHSTRKQCLTQEIRKPDTFIQRFVAVRDEDRIP